MNYRKLKTIENVSSFKVDKENFAFKKNESLFHLGKEIVSGISGYFYYKNDLYFYKESKTYTVEFIKLVGNIVELASFVFTYDFLYEGNILVSSDIKIDDLSTFKISCKYSIIDAVSLAILYELPGRHSNILGFRFKNALFTSEITKTFIKSLSLITGKYQWKANISSFGEIKQILGVADNTLWVWMSEHKLLGLDVNTGKVIHDFYPLQQLFDQGKSWANFPMFNEADKKLYFFEQDFFAAVNLENQTTRVIWQEEGYHISLSVIHDDYIYFIGGKAQGFFKNGIGVFDRQKNEVVWQTEIELGGYVVLNQIQVGDNKIYVLDNEGTLRIYELED